ncbi:MAG TPA: hypothetical protein PK878_16650 [bacterium]|nr:hypothetical protein [Candidatus Omnitrophota bacterium]HOJ61914.1 hypothetical protein [bacterium]HOL96753.1 hypothetical protein [bacterium]HPP02023.1 hypothetical protein [bacterium]HXK93858.1 hypothetical protein [bacterium]
MKTFFYHMAGLGLLVFLGGCAGVDQRHAPSSHSWTHDLNPASTKIMPDWEILDLSTAGLTSPRRLSSGEQVWWDTTAALW